MTLRTREHDLDLLDVRQMTFAQAMEVIQSPDPVLALARRAVEDDDGGDRGQAHARAIFRLAGKTPEEAEASVVHLVSSLYGFPDVDLILEGAPQRSHRIVEWEGKAIALLLAHRLRGSAGKMSGADWIKRLEHASHWLRQSVGRTSAALFVAGVLWPRTPAALAAATVDEPMDASPHFTDLCVWVGTDLPGEMWERLVPLLTPEFGERGILATRLSHSFAVFNNHVHDAGKRAMVVCRANPREGSEALEKADRDGIMAVFNNKPTPASRLYADLVFIFANGFDKLATEEVA